MSLTLAENALHIRPGQRRTDAVEGALDDLEGLLKTYMHHDSSLIFWQVHRILWGRWKGGKIILPEGQGLHAEYTLEMRVFNEWEELHVTAEAGYLSGRYVTDEEGEPSEYVDSLARLRGQRVSVKDSFVTLKDPERQLAMTVPSKEDGTFYGLVTRNYIAYGDNGQAGYGDYRFVSIVNADNTEKGE